MVDTNLDLYPPLFNNFTVLAADQAYSLKIQLGQGLMSNNRITSADLASTNSTMFRTFARSHALLGNVVLQAGTCLVDSQCGDWELAY